MLNKITKYILLIFFLIFFIVLASLTFKSDLRRSIFHKIITVHDFYQLKSITKHVQTRDFSMASKHLLNYIEISKKISKGKSRMLIGVYDVANLVASKASSQKDFNLLEEVFFKLVELDPNLYKARVWLARAVSDTDYKSSLMHLEKAMKISPASEEAYREGIRIAQERQDINLAQKFCSKYIEAQLGGNAPRHYGNYFGASSIRKMAAEFSPESENPIYYSHGGIQLNNFQNYEFVPTSPVDMNGINLYFSFLPGIRVYIKEIFIYSSGEIIKIPIQDFTVSSKSAYIDYNNDENLSFLLVNGEDEILRLRHKNIFKSVEKVIIEINFSRMIFSNKLFCAVAKK